MGEVQIKIKGIYAYFNIGGSSQSHEKTIKEIFGENNIIKTDFDIGEGVVIDSYGFRYIKNII